MRVSLSGIASWRNLPLLLLFVAAAAGGQQPDETGAGDAAEEVPADNLVQVEPQVGDTAIATRLTRIMRATGWFADIDVAADEGVVFLRGTADTAEHRTWAETLAGRTENVVGVVNLLELSEGPLLDFEPAVEQIRDIRTSIIRATPYVLAALFLFIITLLAVRAALVLVRRLVARRISNQLLKDLVARSVGALVLLIGLYLILRISGLTGLAATVLGGTGLIGLALGFAFRDIAENFLASILLSAQRPFATGDRIKVREFDGFVQRVNLRSTLIMDLDGNHVQVPNATIYKEPLINYTANPNSRQHFAVGIGYDDDISKAQSVAMSVLEGHEAVLSEPEPLVLVESLGAATVVLRVYFWVDITRHSEIKVASSVIRRVKQAFDAARISMPDEAREVVFPAGVPVEVTETADEAGAQKSAPAGGDSSPRRSEGEGDLKSDAAALRQQAEKARLPEGGTNLLGE